MKATQGRTVGLLQHAWQAHTRLPLVTQPAAAVRSTLPQEAPLGLQPSVLVLPIKATQGRTVGLLQHAQRTRTRLPLVLLPAPAVRSTLAQEAPQPRLLSPPVWLMLVTLAVEAVWRSVRLALSRCQLHHRMRALFAESTHGAVTWPRQLAARARCVPATVACRHRALMKRRTAWPTQGSHCEERQWQLAWQGSSRQLRSLLLPAQTAPRASTRLHLLSRPTRAPHAPATVVCRHRALMKKTTAWPT